MSMHGASLTSPAQQIPESVSDRSSPAYNGGQTGLYRSSAATMEAYSAQAKEDLLNFLAARAEEMSDEGVLCLNFRCRDSGISSPYSTAHEVIGDCIWDDFVDKVPPATELLFDAM